jgi:hypothetical protein
MEDDIFELPPPPKVEASSNPRWGQRTTEVAAPSINDQNTFELPPPKQAISTSEDVARSAAGQGTLGISDIAGVPGSLGQLYDVGAKAATKYLIAKPAEYLGMLPQGKTAEQMMADFERVGQQFQSPAEKEGNVNYVAGLPLPTGKGVEETVQKALPYTAYEPQTPEGKYAGSAARMATGTAVMGGVSNIPRNLAVGATAGLTSEAAGEASENYLPDWMHPYARVLGAVVGNTAGNKLVDAVKYVGMPNATAEKALIDAMATDIQNGHSAMSVDQIQSAIDSGATPTAFDMAGPKTKSVLQKYGYLNDDSKVATSKLADVLEQRKTESKANLGQHIDDQFSGTLDPAAQADAITKDAQVRNNILYKTAREDPKAQSLWNDELANLSKIDAVKQAMKKANSIATDPESGIVTYKPGTPTRQVAGNILDEYGNPVTQTIEGKPPTYPNLTYWDQVKRNLDDQVSSAVTSRKRDEVRRLTNLKNRLVNTLDNSVDNYAAARDSAADAFGGKNALEAGYNYFKGTNSFTNQEATNAFNKMTDAQKDLFARGGAGYLKEIAENQGSDSLLTMLKKPIYSNRIKTALGQDTFDSIYGRAEAESLLSKTKQLPPPNTAEATSGNGLLFPAIVGGGSAAASHILESFLQGHLSVSPTTAAAGAIGATVGLGAKLGFNAAESRIAPRIMEMVSDPSRAAELGRLAQSNADARSALDKLNSATTSALLSYYRSNPKGYNTGGSVGRVKRASGGKVNSNKKQMLVKRLMDLAEKAKKEVSKNTEPLLNAPDEAIVKALHVANQAI